MISPGSPSQDHFSYRYRRGYCTCSVTGMDTSTVDVIADIINLCDRNSCKLFISGANHNLRSVLRHAGVKPLGGDRSKRKLRFFNSLDIAIGKAEDNLLDIQLQEKDVVSTRKLPALIEESGFQVALRYIDEQVILSFQNTVCVHPLSMHECLHLFFPL